MSPMQRVLWYQGGALVLVALSGVSIEIAIGLLICMYGGGAVGKEALIAAAALMALGGIFVGQFLSNIWNGVSQPTVILLVVLAFIIFSALQIAKSYRFFNTVPSQSFVNSFYLEGCIAAALYLFLQ